MRLSDSEDDGPGIEREDVAPAGGDMPEERPVPDPSAADPATFVEAVADELERDPVSAIDRVGGLLAVAREHDGPVRVTAGEALDAIGRRQPDAFDVWAADLAAAARSADDELAFFGLRALAQLAAVDPNAASRGLDAALDNLGAPDADLRQAALAVLAEVGPRDPDDVRRADRPLATALTAEAPSVRTAAAIAAGRLLGSAPNGFPRTATALLDALDDEDEAVRTYAHVALANFATEHPDNVPEKARALSALAGVTDDELGLRRGTLGEAMAALVAREFEEGTAAG